jgi:uncharacterized protein YwqG
MTDLAAVGEKVGYMPKRASITFMPAPAPIRDPVTKFGGQPVWLTLPEWPLSRATGQPMAFICQIALTPELFEGAGPGMAYLFMTREDDEGVFVDGTWEPDSGENAIIIQAGSGTGLSQPRSDGATLYAMHFEPGQRFGHSVPVEFSVALTLSEDPAMVSQPERASWDDNQHERYAQALNGNKLGGTPYFIQNDELLIRGDWHLLLQLDSTQVPFQINFGDAGVGYGFISKDGRVGKFLWQCY